MQKIYLADALKKGQIACDFWGGEYGNNKVSVEEIKALFGFMSFDFPKEKIRLPLEKAYEAKKHIMDYVFTDSMGERKFAEALDKADEVCVYARLPRTFQIPTPVGKYAPDWAIAFNDNMGVRHVFFVAETKGSMLSMNLKGAEMAKIECAKRLFNSVSTSKVRYHEITDYDMMLDVINSLA